MSHKFKHENIDKLINLEKYDNNIFPLTKIITTYYKNINMYINNFCAMMLDILLTPDVDNIFLKSIYNKARLAYDKKDVKTKISMLISASSVWNEESYNVFKKAFPEFEQSVLTKSMSGIIKQIAIHIEPWNSNKNEQTKKINEILNNDNEINKKILLKFLKLSNC